MSDGEVRYRFLSVVGEGGFGKVYRARKETSDGFNKDVAIKVLHDDDPPRSLLKRFRDEARILGLIRDRAIVGVEPPIRIGDRWAVVMDYVDGVSAGALLSRGPLPAGVAVEIVGEVARALHNAFQMEGPEGPLQLLHRDIKPDNIQVTPSGDIRILDFGIARANFAAREFHTRQSIGGTPGYIAPERLNGTEDPRGDVYSLGVVLHELVTGQRPTFSPTLHLDADFGDDDETNAATPMGAPDRVMVDTDDLEVEDWMLEDEHLKKVLTLAGWMRAYEPHDRPSARQVEEACRQLREVLPTPFLRNWAESDVPTRNDLDPDALVGQLLTTAGTTFSFPPSAPPAPVAGVSLPPPDGGTPAPVVPTQGQGGAVVMAAGGVGLAFVGVGALGVALLLGLFVAFVQVTNPQGRGSDPVTDGREGVVVPPPVAPDPVPTAIEPDPVAPDPAPAAPDPMPAAPDPAPTRPDPAPAAPDPAPSKPEPVVITLPGADTPTAEPEPAAPAPTRTGPTGMVIVRTVPSGAVVRLKGEVLTRTGRGYVLPIGSHVLDLESGGERTRIPVFVARDETVEICYSFDTNSACGQ